LINFGWFASHSNRRLPWKIDCDALTDHAITAIAQIIRGRFAFGGVYGVPSGGTRLANALESRLTPEYPLLIVDDVLTTGKSMNDARQRVGMPNTIGVVIFARGLCPNWVWPIFSVNDWSQAL